MNIEDVEQGLEGIRAEERVTGYIPYIVLLSIRCSNPFFQGCSTKSSR